MNKNRLLSRAPVWPDIVMSLGFCLVILGVVLARGCKAPDKKVTALEYEKVSAEAAR